MKGLTPRQLEFLALHARGYRYEDIQRKFFISYRTVDNTCASARRRTGSRTNAQCIAWAIAHEQLVLDHEGIVSLPGERNPRPWSE